MIIEMEKLTSLVYHKEYETFLNGARDLGVVHVAGKQQGAAGNTELQNSIRLFGRLRMTEKLLQALEPVESAVTETTVSAARGLEALNEVDELQVEKSKLQQLLQTYQREEVMLEPWENFEPTSLSHLYDVGLMVGFYNCSESNYDSLQEEVYNATVINRLSSRVYFVTVAKNVEGTNLDAGQAKLPSCSLEHVQVPCDEMEQALADNEKRLKGLAGKELLSLRAALKEVNTDMEFSKIMLNTEAIAGEEPMLSQGQAPAFRIEEISTWLDAQHVYYEITSPVLGDNMPAQLNNKDFLVWFGPMCKLYMLPRYNELGLTPFFAPFFMVFFGLCLGDSGYRLFLFLGATLYRLFAKNISVTMRSILSLIQVSATSTFFCGLLTGTFFGANIYDIDLPFFQKVKETLFMDDNDMFQLSLILGAVQILFGVVLKVINQGIQFGIKYTVATVGWIILLISYGMGALLPKVAPLGGMVHLCILGIAAAMIFLYNSPRENIFLNIGPGLWDSYSTATSLLDDVLPYMYLFVLGLSGGILAGVLNNSTMGMSPDNAIAGPIVMVSILVMGHAISISVNVLGAMVHPMRLTLVEFFENSGYEGGRKEYKLFKK